MKIEISLPDAQALLALLGTSDAYPDVVEELVAGIEDYRARERRDACSTCGHMERPHNRTVDGSNFWCSITDCPCEDFRAALSRP